MFHSFFVWGVLNRSEAEGKCNEQQVWDAMAVSKDSISCESPSFLGACAPGSELRVAANAHVAGDATTDERRGAVQRLQRLLLLLGPRASHSAPSSSHLPWPKLSLMPAN